MKGFWTRRRLGGALFLAFSLFYGWRTSLIARLPVDATEAATARTVPYALALLGGLLAVYLLCFGGQRGEDAAPTAAAPEAGNLLVAGALLLLLVAFGLLLPRVGFGVAAFGFLLAGFLLLGERRWTRVLGVAAATTAALLVGLRYGLGLYLAPGDWWSL